MNWPALILHVQSTMRMGTSAADSVLDENAKSRCVDGLSIADNSASANALGGPNPTLTCQALATRTAAKILIDAFGGTPFVSGGSPADDRSVDHRGPGCGRALSRAPRRTLPERLVVRPGRAPTRTSP